MVASTREGLSFGDVAQGNGEPAGDGTFGWRLPATTLAAIRPGRYWWQAVARWPDGTVERGPAQSYVVHLRGNTRSRGPIPRRFGRHGKGAFAVSRRGLPPEVPLHRLWSLARRSAARWGLRAAGVTKVRAIVGDGYNVVGFGRLRMAAFGKTTTRKADKYERTVRCDATRCVEIGRRYVGTVIVERDIVLNDRVLWAPAPGYPSLDEADPRPPHPRARALRGQRPRPDCTGSPMGPSGGLGDWWRSPVDRFALGCIRGPTR